MLEESACFFEFVSLPLFHPSNRWHWSSPGIFSATSCFSQVENDGASATQEVVPKAARSSLSCKIKNTKHHLVDCNTDISWNVIKKVSSIIFFRVNCF